MKKIYDLWVRVSLIKKIGIGVVIGVMLGILAPDLTGFSILGKLFVGGLKAIAPLLVFALVSQAISHQKKGKQTNMT
ncbi:TPA: serine/threonine transporter SstT, partial [Streptococcus pyogenes]